MDPEQEEARIWRQFWKIIGMEREVQPDLWSDNPEVSSRAVRYYGEPSAIRQRLDALLSRGKINIIAK